MYSAPNSANWPTHWVTIARLKSIDRKTRSSSSGFSTRSSVTMKATRATAPIAMPPMVLASVQLDAPWVIP